MIGMFSQIIDLPPLKRGSHHNTLIHMLIGASNIDRDQFLTQNSNDFTIYFQKEILLPNIEISVKINITAVVCDLIELPKLFNLKQFNSLEGACIKCFIKPSSIKISKLNNFKDYAFKNIL